MVRARETDSRECVNVCGLNMCKGRAMKNECCSNTGWMMTNLSDSISQLRKKPLQEKANASSRKRTKHKTAPIPRFTPASPPPPGMTIAPSKIVLFAHNETRVILRA